MTWPLTTRVTDELIDAAIWNNEVVANLNVANPSTLMRPIVIKPSDEGPISSTTFQADNDLIVPVLANEVWLLQYFLRFVAAGATADPKVQWTFPTGGVANMAYVGANDAGTVVSFHQGTDTSPLNPSQALGAHTTNTYGFMHGPITVMYVNGGTGGNVGLDWAPNAAANLTMKARSSVWGAKLA